jgi:hypothetical protein
MTKNQKLENEKFFKQLISCSKFWLWLDKSESFLIDGGKISPTTERGEKLVKKIISSDFYNSYFIPFNDNNGGV